MASIRHHGRRMCKQVWVCEIGGEDEPHGQARKVVPTVNTSEVPTFFGPSSSPLFGVLHLPEDGQMRGGVIICGSLAKEGMDSVRLQRILADGLADRGFGVLRFDYLGTGDSAYAQNRDDAVDNWRRSIDYGLSYLREIGAQSITAIGLRAGGLILSAVLAGSHSVDRVVYLDPTGTGRRYLREQTSLFMLLVGRDSAPVGTVSIIGARMSAEAAKEFRALSLEVSPPGVDYLLVLRSGELDAQVSALAKLDRVQSVTVEGLPEFVQSAKIITPMPLAAIDKVIAWIDAAESTIRSTATPRFLTSVKMPTEGPSDVDAVVESIESIGPGGLFAIRTRPEHSLPGEGKVVLFHSAANDPHIGPTREWVELSRRAAQCGAQALRWDRRGVGQSGAISRRQWRWIYSRRDIADAIAAAEHAARNPCDLQIVGVCSGSWYAAHTARALGVGSVTLVNVMIWNWRTVASYLWQWNVKRSLHAEASSKPGYNKVEGLRKRFVASLKPVRGVLRNVVHSFAPRFVLLLLGRLGLAQVPAAMLAPLARNGAPTTVLLCPQDAELFATKGGYSAVQRLERALAPPRLVTTQLGDHAAYHQAMLEAIRQTVMTSIAPMQNLGAYPSRVLDSSDSGESF
jgi:predicted alpha/beta hydrolase